MSESKQVVIQKRIQEVMNREFSLLIKEYSKHKLLDLLINDKIKNMEIEDLTAYLSDENDE